MEYKAGEIFEVTCAKLRWREDLRIYNVPVFDHCHNDPQFGFPHDHYHIDGRFELHPRMRHFFKLDEGKTQAVITKASKTFEFLGIVTRSMRCIRLETGLNFSVAGENIALYKDWYKSFVGRQCKGKRCPHFGTQMLEQNGQLVCPMHGLTADSQTLLIIPDTLTFKPVKIEI